MSTIHGVPLSPFVRKLMIFMDEKGLNYEQTLVTPGDPSPDFRAISPLGKVPAYSDEQVAISDSSVICAYLEKVHPTPAMYPVDPVGFARALWFEEYADSRFMDTSGALYFQTCLAEKFFGRPADQARIDEVSAGQLPDVLDYLEPQTPEQGYLLGERVGIADCALGTNLVNLRHAGFEPDPASHPRLAAYRDRLFGRDSFARALAREDAIFASR